MSIQLTQEEQLLRDEIAERMQKARKVFSEYRTDDDVAKWINEAGKMARKLHMRLKKRGHEPKHHGYMIKNRGMSPSAKGFYLHFHPIEDLLKFIENEHANDDPEDQTIGVEFTISFYSNRWKHNDKYRIKRTVDGWDLSGIPIGGPCDKGGRPFLFRHLRHDSIQYPEGLDGWLEWLWYRAASDGLSRDQVQSGLDQLADWVSMTEKHAPSGGIWQGY